MISLVSCLSQSWATTKLEESLNKLLDSRDKLEVKTKNLSNKTDAEVCDWATSYTNYGWSNFTEWVKEAKSRNYTNEKCNKLNLQNTSDKTVCYLSESYNFMIKDNNNIRKKYWLKEAKIREKKGLNCKVCNYKNFDIKKDYLEAHLKIFSDDFNKSSPNPYYNFTYPLHCTNYYALFMEGFYFFMQERYFSAEISFYSLIKYNNEHNLLKKNSFNNTLMNWSKIYSILSKHKILKNSNTSVKSNLCSYYKQPLFQDIGDKFKSVIKNIQIRDKCVEGEEKGISLVTFFLLL